MFPSPFLLNAPLFRPFSTRRHRKRFLRTTYDSPRLMRKRCGLEGPSSPFARSLLVDPGSARSLSNARLRRAAKPRAVLDPVPRGQVCLADAAVGSGPRRRRPAFRRCEPGTAAAVAACPRSPCSGGVLHELCWRAPASRSDSRSSRLVPLAMGAAAFACHPAHRKDGPRTRACRRSSSSSASLRVRAFPCRLRA